MDVPAETGPALRNATSTNNEYIKVDNVPSMRDSIKHDVT